MSCPPVSLESLLVRWGLASPGSISAWLARQHTHDAVAVVRALWPASWATSPPLSDVAPVSRRPDTAIRRHASLTILTDVIPAPMLKERVGCASLKYRIFSNKSTELRAGTLLALSFIPVSTLPCSLNHLFHRRSWRSSQRAISRSLRSGITGVGRGTVSAR